MALKVFFCVFPLCGLQALYTHQKSIAIKSQDFQNGGLDEKLKINNEFTGLKIKKGISVKDARG